MSRRSVRTERRLFLADGPKAVEGALGVDGCVVEIFATPAAAEQYGALLPARDAEVPVTLVDERALASLSDAVNPAGLVAVCRHLHADSDALYRPRPTAQRSGPLIAMCADIRDPGNLGTVIRCADASGADGVMLAGDSVDPYNPKTVRASVGSLFHLPIAHDRDPLAAVREAQAAGLQVLATDGAGEVDLYDADELVAGPVAWLFGNEAWGLPDDLAAAADHRVRIPIHGRAESLNLATAAAVCLYASARARRTS